MCALIMYVPNCSLHVALLMCQTWVEEGIGIGSMLLTRILPGRNPRLGRTQHNYIIYVYVYIRMYYV